MTNLRALPEGTDDYKYVEHDFEMENDSTNSQQYHTATS